MWYTKTSKDIKQTACVASWMTEQTAGRAKRLVWKLVRNLYANKKKKKSHQISEATSPSLIKCQKHQQPPLPFLRKWFKICKWRWLSRALSSRKKKKKHSLLYSFKECFFFFLPFLFHITSAWEAVHPQICAVARRAAAKSEGVGSEWLAERRAPCGVFINMFCLDSISLIKTHFAYHWDLTNIMNPLQPLTGLQSRCKQPPPLSQTMQIGPIRYIQHQNTLRSRLLFISSI